MDLNETLNSTFTLSQMDETYDLDDSVTQAKTVARSQLSADAAITRKKESRRSRRSSLSIPSKGNKEKSKSKEKKGSSKAQDHVSETSGEKIV